MTIQVHDPFMKELLTIALGEFKVEDKNTQIQFWTILNSMMEKNGYSKPMFRGFMEDEAMSNWLAIQTIYNGGTSNIMIEK